MGLGWWFQPYDPKRDAREKEQRQREKERERREEARYEREYARQSRADRARKIREYRAEDKRQLAEEKVGEKRRRAENAAARKSRPPIPARRATAKRVTVRARAKPAPASRPRPRPTSTAKPAPAPARPAVVPLAVAERAARDLTRAGGTFTASQLQQELVQYGHSSKTDPAPVLARLQAAGKVRRMGSGYAAV